MNRDWLAERAHTTPGRLALIYGGRSWDYRELDRRVEMVASRLGRELSLGDCAAVLMSNDDQAVVLIHALARLGAILAPLNRRLTSRELAGQLEQLKPKLLIYDDSSSKAAEAIGDHVRRQFHFATFEQELGPALETPPFDLNRRQAIIFTSGTTGTPKGAMLSFANHFWSASASAFRLGLNRDDRWLSCLPLFHVGGLAVLFRSCLYGTTVVLHDRFDVEAIGEALENQAITITSLVPTMMHRLLEWRGQRPWPPNLRTILLGGAAASPRLIERCLEQDAPICITYGLTEAASQVATMTTDGVRRKPGSAGRPLLFNDLAIVDDDGRPLPAGQVGEVTVGGPIVMQGYLNNESANKSALREGRLFTGDMGYVDDDGDLWLVQRRVDIVVSGGENIYPVEIEGVLSEHPQVVDACVVGLPDAEWGQIVAAAVVFAPGTALTEQELETYCRQKLAGYKLPRRWEFTSSLSRTASGKPRRQEIAQLFLDVPKQASTETPNRCP